MKVAAKVVYELAGGFGRLPALIDSPACRFIKYMYLHKALIYKLIDPFCWKKRQKSENHKINNNTTLCKYKKWMLVTDKLKAQ